MAYKGGYTWEVLIKGLQDEKKYTFTDNDLTDVDIMKMIENKSMNISEHCFSRADNSTFSKIRSGLIKKKKEQIRTRKSYIEHEAENKS